MSSKDLNLKKGSELLYVSFIFLLASIFGWTSLYLNQGLIRNLYKTVDPGSGLLPLIILFLISLGCIFYFSYGLYIIKSNKEKLYFNFIKFDLLTIYFFISIILCVLISPFISYLVSITIFMILWMIILTSKSELLSKRFFFDLTISSTFLFTIVYVCFIKIMNTPFP